MPAAFAFLSWGWSTSAGAPRMMAAGFCEMAWLMPCTHSEDCALVGVLDDLHAELLADPDDRLVDRLQERTALVCGIRKTVLPFAAPALKAGPGAVNFGMAVAFATWALA